MDCFASDRESEFWTTSLAHLHTEIAGNLGGRQLLNRGPRVV